MNAGSKLVRKLLKNKVIIETDDLKNRLKQFNRYRTMSIRLSDMNIKYNDLTKYCRDKSWLTVSERDNAVLYSISEYTEQTKLHCLPSGYDETYISLEILNVVDEKLFADEKEAWKIINSSIPNIMRILNDVIYLLQNCHADENSNKIINDIKKLIDKRDKLNDKIDRHRERLMSYKKKITEEWNKKLDIRGDFNE